MNKNADFIILSNNDIVNTIYNNSKIYFNGSEWFNNKYEKFTIMGKVDSKSKNSKYICKFDDGSVDVFLSNCISSGRVKNKNTPIVYGNGFIGYGKYKTNINGKATREYKLWSGVLQRAYSNNFKINNPKYKNVEVDSDWHSFQKFCEDIELIENYKNWKSDKNKLNIWELDKDFLSEKLKCNKIYSKETCKFMINSENSKLARIQQRDSKIKNGIFIAKRISDNYEEEFKSLTMFANKYKLNISNISLCINNKQKSHKGWSFRFKDGKLTEHKGE